MKKWQNAKRTHDVFVKYNDKSFRDSSDRTKRRRTEEIRRKYSHEELGFVTQMSLRAEGKSNVAKIVKDVTLGSLSKAARY